MGGPAPPTPWRKNGLILWWAIHLLMAFTLLMYAVWALSNADDLGEDFYGQITT